MEPADIEARLSLLLGRAGIDIVHLLALDWYNSSIPDELGARIPVRGSAGQQALVVLIGNSRSVWEAFLEELAGSGELQGADNPLELYLQRHVDASLAAAAPGQPYRIYWSHKRTADLEPPRGGGEASAHVAFQRMAHHSGLAYLDHDSHLCLHPRFGPWFSLRCAAIFDDIPLNAPRPCELPHPLPTATQQYVRMALHTAVHNTSRKFRLPELDVEAAEAVLAEASIEPLLDADSDEEESQQQLKQQQHPAPMVPSGPSGSDCSTAGSDPLCASGGSTPCASSGCSSPRPCPGLAAHPAAQRLVEAAAVRAAAAAAAEPVPVPAFAPVNLSEQAAAVGSSPPAGARLASSLSGRSPSVGSLGSLGSLGSRRASMERESRPSMRAVAANWRAWVAVRDSPCPGHPMRYSEEQIEYHYTRSRSVLAKALLRRNLGPSTPLLPASGLLDPALQSYHEATRRAQKQASSRHDRGPAAAPAGPAAPAAAAAEPITAP